MDIFAHALWTTAGARAVNSKLAQKHERLIRVGWTAFWGVFPDLFAFVLPMMLSIPTLIQNGLTFGRPSSMGLSANLYQYSHSLVIWLAVFLVVWLTKKRPAYELCGWALHILIDIPSHAANFYPTPFLFPVSSYKFLHGISWGNKYYMIINYTSLIVVFGYFFIHKMKMKRAQKTAQDYLASK